ncbi:MAG: DUF2090 domain-containing protein [archaeon]|nr:DUF2090 domain-containing protein [archaeon]
MGYKKDLLILPFDHRGSLLKKLFGVEGREPTSEEAEKYADLKHMVYEGFLQSLEMGVPKEKTAVLVDAQFGEKIISDAKKRKIMVAMPVEKSGQEEFDFDEQDFRGHIKRVDPDFVKVLVRFNPEEKGDLNTRQLKRLRQVSDFSREIGKKFIFELLVPPLPKQLATLGDTYDLELRPKLMVKAIRQIQDAGVEPDVWKLEGVSKKDDSQALVAQCHAKGRTSGIITLGRGEDANKVKEWLKVGAKINGIIGFAVGRTIFWEPMKNLNSKKISRKEAINQVANNYKQLVDLWESERSK